MMGKVISIKGASEVEAEAAAWIVQLDGKKPTKKDLVALAEWMAQSPRHREAIMEMSAMWGELNQLTALLAEPQAEKQKSSQWIGRTYHRSGWIRGALALLAFAFFSGVVAITIRNYWGEAESSSVYETAVGEQKRVVLSDGSVIRINTKTYLTTEYSKTERRITLDSGEAMFEVMKDSSRPFVVAAGDSEIYAIGTAFSVRYEGELVEVTVSEGIVDFQAPSRAEAMSPGAQIKKDSEKLKARQAVEYTKGEAVVTELEQDELVRLLAWRDGALAFRGESLEYVVTEVSRYADIEFVFDDESLRDLRVGGYFGIGEIAPLLAALEEGFGVSSRRAEDGKIHLSLNETT